MKIQYQVLFGENHDYLPMGNGYLDFDINFRKADNTNSTNADGIRLVNNVFAYTIHDARKSTSTGIEIEQKKYVGPISTVMCLITEKDGDLFPYFDVINESEAGINNSSLKQILINNHTDVNKGVIRGYLPLEFIFWIRENI